MKLQTAELITHGEQMDGINCAVRAVVRLDGKDVAAIVKKIEQPLIAAECFAALLLKGWGLSVPEPILVKLHDDTYAFGSLEVKYPSLKQSLSLDKLPDTAKEAAYKKLAAIIGTWKQTPLAIASDEAIGNKDRNTGNILWDGGEPWFVDHERSFGLIAQEDLNKLAMMVRMGDDVDTIQKSSLGAVFLLLESVIDDAYQATITLDTLAYNDYIKKRIPSLASMILQRFPQPQDLLNPN